MDNINFKLFNLKYNKMYKYKNIPSILALHLNEHKNIRNLLLYTQNGNELCIKNEDYFIQKDAIIPIECICPYTKYSGFTNRIKYYMVFITDNKEYPYLWVLFIDYIIDQCKIFIGGKELFESYKLTIKSDIKL